MSSDAGGLFGTSVLVIGLCVFCGIAALLSLSHTLRPRLRAEEEAEDRSKDPPSYGG